MKDGHHGSPPAQEKGEGARGTLIPLQKVMPCVFLETSLVLP